MQKGELNGKKIYSKLARITNNSNIAKELNKISQEENSHSQIIKKITKRDVKSSQIIANIIGFMYRFLGLKKILYMTAKGQSDTAKKYVLILDKFPELSVVAQQEKKHAETLQKIASNL